MKHDTEENISMTYSCEAPKKKKRFECDESVNDTDSIPESNEIDRKNENQGKTNFFKLNKKLKINIFMSFLENFGMKMKLLYAIIY